VLKPAQFDLVFAGVLRWLDQDQTPKLQILSEELISVVDLAGQFGKRKSEI